MPCFTEEPERERETDAFNELIRSFTDGVDEYQALDPRFRRILTFVDYFHLKEKYIPGVGLLLEVDNIIRFGIIKGWQES